MLSVPSGSTANVGANGGFVDGVALVQNPSFIADVAGGTYVLQAMAENVDGWSDPIADREASQQCVVIKTSDLLLPVPGEYQYKWATYLNEVVALLEASASLPATDNEAIHDNVNGEVNALTLKAAPTSSDIILIEDAADSYAKKKVTLTDAVAAGLPTTGWKYLSAVQPAGAPAPAAVWRFDGSVNQLVDLIAGFTLVTGGGEVPYSVRVQGLTGIWPLGSTSRTLQGGNDASWDPLRITGDLTLELLLFHSSDSAQGNIISMGAANTVSPGSTTNRQLYGFRRVGITAGMFLDTRFVFYNDSNGQINVPSGGVVWGAGDLQQAEGNWTYIAAVRDMALNKVRLYTDGLPYRNNPFTPANSLTSYYSTSRLCLFRDEVSTEIHCGIASVRITAGKYTDAQILAAWDAIKPY